MLKLVLAYSLPSFFFGLFGVNWDAVDRKIDNQFPEVEFVSTDELQVSYQQENLPVIVDVREPAEFAVSHLGSAANLETGAAIAARFPDKSTPIVVYCSVGYRSARVAAELMTLGYSDVRNLRHSIFEWAEKGYSLRNAAGETSQVHPYNRAWGSLIDSDFHAYSP